MQSSSSPIFPPKFEGPAFLDFTHLERAWAIIQPYLAGLDSFKRVTSVEETVQLLEAVSSHLVSSLSFIIVIHLSYIIFFRRSTCSPWSLVDSENTNRLSAPDFGSLICSCSAQPPGPAA